MSARNSLVGSPIERFEDLRFLRGRGQYIDDLARPGLLHGAILRSSVAHGVIRAVDTAAARALPGVHAVITAPELGPTVPHIPMRMEAAPDLARFVQPVLASAKVRYVGEPVVLAIADSVAIAEDALELVQLDIEPLPVVADTNASFANNVVLFEEHATNLAMTISGICGDADKAVAEAPYVRRERFKVHRHTALPMETRGVLADWDAAAGKLTVFGVAKAPFATRATLAQLMGLPIEAIDALENDVGGGFGARGEFYPEDFLIPFAARLTGRSVKWVEDRRDHFLATAHAREVACEIEIACRSDGTILALRGRAYSDMGAYIRPNAVTAPRNLAQVISGPYRVPNVHLDVVMMMTNKVPAASYRGPGRFEADFFRERLIDLAADDLGIDRVEFRRRNLVSDAEMPYALPVVQPYNAGAECDSGDYQATFDRCLKEIGWDEKKQLAGKLIDGRYRGLGVGCYIEGGASGPKETARLVLERDGTISVFVGSSAIGQGTETIFAQIAADALELPIERICGVFHGSTTFVSEGFGSYASRATVMGGSAILAAAANLRKAMANAAARRLSCRASEIRFDGPIINGPAARALTLDDLGSEGLSAEGTFANSKRTYSYGAHAAHVAVDSRTGHVEILDYVSVEDVGRIINPGTLHGQIVGAIVQGLGAVFLEALIYDEQGQLLTASLADYLTATAGDFPNINAIALEQHPSPNNPLGAKGAGEGGIIAVGGVMANAIASALSSLKIQPRELPLSPVRVWDMMAEARRSAGQRVA